MAENGQASEGAKAKEEPQQEIKFGSDSNFSEPKHKTRANPRKLQEEMRQELEMQMGLKKHENDTKKLDAFLDIWKLNQTTEQKLKEYVAKRVFRFLLIEIFAANVILLMYGFSWLTFPAWIAETFFTGVFIQVIAIVTIVVKNLFPPTKDTLSELTKMFEKL